MNSKKIESLILKEFNKKNHFNFKRINVAFPYFNQKEIMAVLDSLLKLQISQGEKTKYFESKFGKSKYGIFKRLLSGIINIIRVKKIVNAGRK